ncbi:MAG: pyruvate kinase [Rikenellaceae bacterium]
MKKKTKIIATISDFRCEVEYIRNLFEAGMNVVRINTAHCPMEAATQIVKNVREVSESIAILIDTKGPEMRTTKVAEAFEVKSGDEIKVTGTVSAEDVSSREMIYVNDVNFVEEVPVGSFVLIDDGDIELEVIGKNADELICRVGNGGLIKSRKSVNVPNVPIMLPSLTAKDIDYIHWAIEQDIEFVAHSFVRTGQDLIDIQEILDAEHSHIKLIAKIENQQGVDNIDEILDHCYSVMVARGDLGVELNAEQIPIAQRSLVKKCIQSKKPVIIATQMLHSMIENPRPTRAEVSDIANAIYQRVDAIMLSGETANGKYPVEAVRTMTKVAIAIEANLPEIEEVNMVRVNNEVTAQLSRSAVRSTQNLPIKAIITDTLSGRTARYLSAYRATKPVYALCYRKHVARELALSFGIAAYYGEPSIIHDRFSFQMLQKLEDQHKLENEDMVIVIGGSFGASRGASFVEISKVLHLMNKAMIED